MRERRQPKHGAAEDSGLLEERLRALYAAAYPPNSSPATPSEALRRRVAGLTARHDAQTGRARLLRSPMPISVGSALGIAAALLLLAVFGLTHRTPTPLKELVQRPRSHRGAPTPNPPAKGFRGPIARLSPRPADGTRRTPGSVTPFPEDRATQRARENLSPTPAPRTPSPAPDDLDYVNPRPAVLRQWASLPANDWERIEGRIRGTMQVRDDFIQIPFPRLASRSDEQVAAAVEGYRREAAIVDPRLSREVNLAFKATALSDLCDRLRADTGLYLEAGRSVADEKVTIFCEKMPLRDVMRQLARPFGYTWLRSSAPPGPANAGGATGYRYELVQDLRSQLLEEELRNRDRNAALLALDRDMQRYRPYLSLTPDEARSRAAGAPTEEKKLLERLANKGWGPIQVYARLSRDDLAALRSGLTLIFSQEPKPGERSLSPELARGVIQCLRDVRLIRRGDGYDFSRKPADPETISLTAIPDTRAFVRVSLNPRDLGQMVLEGSSGFTTVISGHESAGGGFSDGPLAAGMSPTVVRPDNAGPNAALARDSALRPHIAVHPVASCRPEGGQETVGRRPGTGDRGRETGDGRPTPASPVGGEAVSQPKVSSADVLEALHRATGMPIVADFYTRLYRLEAVTVGDRPLFDALNRLADAMRLRWSKDDRWLQFRSTSYYDDRLKEVPNRLLTRWAAARRQRGMLTLDELIEIEQLSDAQLDAAEMAEGARECFGLIEWDLARSRSTRGDWHFLAQLTAAQRQEARGASGLSFTRMSLAQQQQFIAVALGSNSEGLRSLEELSGASLRVVYTQPGGFEWPGIGHPTVLQFRPSPVQERTREAALQAARRFDPQVTEAQIVPTELAVTILYTCGSQPRAYVRVERATPRGTTGYNGRPRPVDSDPDRRTP